MIKCMVVEVSILGRIVDFLSSAPSDEAIMQIKASGEETQRLEDLTALQQSNTISPEERDELKEALIAEQIMVMAKANAYGRMQNREA